MANRSERGWWGWALFVALAMYVAPLTFSFPLLDPDEGLHAAIGQEMVERSDYVTPRLLGTPFYDKPIFYFWMQAASLRVFGMHTWAVRLPGLLCGLLGAATTALLSRRLWNQPVAAPLAALVYLTMVVPLALAQAAVHDIALVPCTNLALWCWLTADERSDDRRAWWLWHVAAGVAVGAAMLTKGLVGVALVGLTLGTNLILSRRLTVRAVCGGALMVATALVIAAPWYWQMHQLHEGYLHYFFVERHVQGFATSTQRHSGRPWWYYLPILMGGSLPWLPDLCSLVLLAVTRKLPQAVAHVRSWIFLAACLASNILFLSLAGSKLWTYCLPLFPALAILVVRLWLDYLSDAPVDEPLWYRRLVAGISTIVSLGALPLSVSIVAKKFSLHVTPPLWVAAVLGGVSLTVWRWLWLQGRYRVAIGALVSSLVYHFGFIMGLIVPLVATNSSSAELARHFNAVGQVPAQLVVLDDRLGAQIFYLHPELRKGLKSNQIRTVLQELYWSDADISVDAIVVVSNRVTPRLPPDSPFHSAPFTQVGRFRLYQAKDVPAPESVAHGAVDGRPVDGEYAERQSGDSSPAATTMARPN